MDFRIICSILTILVEELLKIERNYQIVSYAL